MAKDFEKDESLSITTERTPGRYPSTEDIDHLTYLEKEKIEVRGRHNHDFPYYGHIVRLGCYRNAPGCMGIERVSNGYSWFRGYSWQIQLCRDCYVQLGWKFMSQDDSFYGLVFKMLREEKPEEDHSANS